jgi:hypothetical protein
MAPVAPRLKILSGAFIIRFCYIPFPELLLRDTPRLSLHVLQLFPIAGLLPSHHIRFSHPLGDGLDDPVLYIQRWSRHANSGHGRY